MAKSTATSFAITPYQAAINPSRSVGFKIWEKALSAPDDWVCLAVTVRTHVLIFNALRNLVDPHTLVLFKVPTNGNGSAFVNPRRTAG